MARFVPDLGATHPMDVNFDLEQLTMCNRHERDIMQLLNVTSVGRIIGLRHLKIVEGEIVYKLCVLWAFNVRGARHLAQCALR